MTTPPHPDTPPYCDPTPLDQATALIEQAWGQPIQDLEALAAQHPAPDPLLRAVMRIRSTLTISSNAVAIHQQRLHALTRPGHTPDLHDQERITRSAAELRVAQAETRTALNSIRSVITARQAALPEADTCAARRSQAALARSAHTSPSPAQPSGPPAPAAAHRPTPAPPGAHR